MKESRYVYETAPFPRLREASIDLLRMGQQKHMIHGLTETDVTEARRYINHHKAETGERLSFTAFIVTCLAKAVDENKRVQAYRSGRNRVIIYDEVDVNTMIERQVDGAPAARFVARLKELVESGYGLCGKDVREML